MDLRTQPVAAAAAPGERPEVFAPARWLAREREVIPSLYHEGLRFQDPDARTLTVQVLVGKRYEPVPLEEGGTIGSRVLPDLTLSVKNVFAGVTD